jgi:kynurenine formamidase
MRITLSVLLVFAGVLGGGCADRGAATSPSRVIDLGHALAETDPSWSGERVFTHTTVATFAKDGYLAGQFSTEEHFGTHLDAPAHFAADGLTVDRIPAERLVRPAVCINVEPLVQANEDYRLTLADVQAFERDHGAIAAGAMVLVATGWDRRWPDAARYMNVRGGVKHFPGVSVEAAAYLARDRQVAGIGIDTPSIDYGPSEQFEAHHTTMPAGVYHVENAANLTSLPPAGFTVVVAPIKIKDGSGGPARVFALMR